LTPEVTGSRIDDEDEDDDENDEEGSPLSGVMLRSCPRSAKAMLRLGGPLRPTGKRRRRRLRLWRFARGGSAGALRKER